MLVRGTAIHVAACNDKVEAIDVLVDAGADLEARNRTGGTPLHHAADRGGLERP